MTRGPSSAVCSTRIQSKHPHNAAPRSLFSEIDAAIRTAGVVWPYSSRHDSGQGSGAVVHGCGTAALLLLRVTQQSSNRKTYIIEHSSCVQHQSLRLVSHNHKCRIDPYLFSLESQCTPPTAVARFEQASKSNKNIRMQVTGRVKHPKNCSCPCSFMVDGGLPSGQQAQDIWDHLQDRLWFADRREAQRVKDLIEANKARRSSPATIEDRDPATAEPTAQPAVTSSSPAAQRTAAATNQAGAAADGSNKEGEEDESAGSVKVETDGHAQQDGREDDDEDEEAKYGARPDSWLHSASLVFALFGRPAGKDEDVDLNLQMSSGPSSGRKRKAQREGSASDSEASCSTSLSGDGPAASLSFRSLQLMNRAGGKLNRAETKKMKHAENVDNKNAKTAQEDAELKRKALTLLSSPPVESKSARELCASVAALTKAVVSREKLDEEAAARARWQQKVDVKEIQLRRLEKRGLGDSEKACKLNDELDELLDNPVVAPLQDPPDVNTSASAGGDKAGAEGGKVRQVPGKETG